MAMKRPNPVLWLYYQYGGRLPARYREWVLRDGTARTWLLRALVRRLIQLAPIMVGLVVGLGVIGGSWPIALGSALLGVLVFLRFSLAYASESVDSRLVRYGYPAQYGSTLRREADKAARAAEAERYRAQWRNTTD